MGTGPSDPVWDPQAVESVGAAPGQGHGRQAAGQVGGVKHDEAGAPRPLVMHEPDEPAPVLAGAPLRVGDEPQLAGVAPGPEVVVLLGTGGQVVLEHDGAVEGPGASATGGVQVAGRGTGEPPVDPPERLQGGI